MSYLPNFKPSGEWYREREDKCVHTHLWTTVELILDQTEASPSDEASGRTLIDDLSIDLVMVGNDVPLQSTHKVGGVKASALLWALGASACVDAVNKPDSTHGLVAPGEMAGGVGGAGHAFDVVRHQAIARRDAAI